MIFEWSRWELANDDPRWVWRDFTPNEMRCKGSGALRVNKAFMDKLQILRDDYGLPITIVSGYRSPAYNAAVSANLSMTGAHTRGRAVDIYVSSHARDVPQLLSLAKKHGMSRCGLQLSTGRFRLHLDDMTRADGFPARDDGELFCWTY